MTEKTRLYNMTDKHKEYLAKQFDEVCAELKNSGADLSKIKLKSVPSYLIDKKE